MDIKLEFFIEFLKSVFIFTGKVTAVFLHCFLNCSNFMKTNIITREQDYLGTKSRYTVHSPLFLRIFI